MGIKGLFDGYKRDYEYMFDMGELYAVSLAKAMGLVAFVSAIQRMVVPTKRWLRN